MAGADRDLEAHRTGGAARDGHAVPAGALRPAARARTVRDPAAAAVRLGACAAPDRRATRCTPTPRPTRCSAARLGLMLTAFDSATASRASKAARAASRTRSSRARGSGTSSFVSASASRRCPARRRAVLAADRHLGARPPARPSRVASQPDPATVKVDWTLDGPCRGRRRHRARSPVVHLGEEGVFRALRPVLDGRPDAVAGRQGDGLGVFARPAGCATPIEETIERLAPGFRALIRGRQVQHLPPGRVNGGTARRQLFLRPRYGRPKIARRRVSRVDVGASRRRRARRARLDRGSGRVGSTRRKSRCA